jgi:hypothetical protein
MAETRYTHTWQASRDTHIYAQTHIHTYTHTNDTYMAG